MNLKESLLANWTNIRSWRSSAKLLVIESDDWGAIRMPGQTQYQALLDYGIPVDRSSPYDRLDGLEDAEDFEQLMGVIEDHRDHRGNPAIFTFNTVMGNPDFDAIKQDRFEHFHHQHFFESYRQYHGQDLEPLWQAAINDGLICPQFHAREHLNSPLWMADLRSGSESLLFAFSQGYYALRTGTSSPFQDKYLAAYWSDSRAHADETATILRDGLRQFKETFGFRSETFIACNYVWTDQLEGVLAEEGVKMLQGQRGRIEPDPNNQGRPKVRRHYTGQRNVHGQRYSVRNVFFEPYKNPDVDWVDRCLNQIARAFRLKAPAIVCTHRINYVGGMDADHRSRNLKSLDRLLKAVRETWPNVDFLSTPDLLERLSES